MRIIRYLLVLGELFSSALFDVELLQGNGRDVSISALHGCCEAVK